MRSLRLLWAVTAGIALVSASPSFASALDCAREVEIAQAPSGRPVRPEDLIGLLDIGSIVDLSDDPMFATSPDGRSVAISVRRAIASENDYCTGIYVFSGNAPPRLIDSGRGVIFWKFPAVIGKANFPTGFPAVITPRWTSNSKAVLFLKLVGGVAQVWMAGASGQSSRSVTNSATDVVDFRLVSDDQTVITKTRDERDASSDRLREGLSGYLFDDRFSPVAMSHPFLQGPLPEKFAAWDLRTGRTRPASPAEIALFKKQPPATPERWSADTIVDEEGFGHIIARKGNSTVRCASIDCTRVLGKPWLASPTRIRYLRRSGFADSLTSVFDWRVGASSPRRIYTTQDLLFDCAAAGHDIMCAREGSIHPRDVVRIDLRTGSVSTVFEPNPGFESFLLGGIERRTWRNAVGIPSFGDLVYPVGYQKGQRYPLIVVQYTSRGFLRGGTGDEYPVQLFANRGYFVLNVQRPRSPLADRRDMPLAARARAELQGFRERRSILSSIETQIRQLVAEGLVDADRVGITGLSDGATTVQFALVNSKMFAAAAVSSCCWEASQAWTLGPAIQTYYRELGWPSLTEDRPEFWDQISLVRAAAHVDTPLLIQASDDEYLATLESVTALRERKRAVDLYVFPGEHHVKREPAHRLAIYLRNLDWFDFWLKGLSPTLAVDHEAAARRWRAMCDAQVSASGLRPCSSSLMSAPQ